MERSLALSVMSYDQGVNDGLREAAEIVASLMKEGSNRGDVAAGNEALRSAREEILARIEK